MRLTIIKNILVEKIDTGLSFTNPVGVFLDRRTPSTIFLTRPLEQIGYAILERRSDGIYATLRILVSGNAVKNLFPNIGYVPCRQAISGEIKTINISVFKNKDKSIPSIKLNQES